MTEFQAPARNTASDDNAFDAAIDEIFEENWNEAVSGLLSALAGVDGGVGSFRARDVISS